MNRSIISARDVVSGYGKETVINQLSLDVAEGDFIGVIGPNGSGKSTLLKTLTGVLPLMSGEIALMERDLKRISAREIACIAAVIPQETTIFFSFTVEEVVAMGRHPHLGRFRKAGREDQRIVEEAMTFTDTIGIRRRDINQISGGERQRAIIARALAQQPRVLFLDEPTSHLDINHQIEVFNLLRKLNEERGMTVFAITHDLNICAEYCREVLMLKRGRITCRGVPSEIISEENIRSVYGAEVVLLENPRSGAPIVSIVSG